MGREIHRNNVRAGFTLVELLVVIAIIGILLAMLVPAVFGLIESSRTSHCLRKLKEQHTFYQTAVNNYGPKVNAKTVRIYSRRYVPEDSAGEEIWNCDANPLSDTTPSYGYNIRLHRMDGGKDNKRIIAMDYDTEIFAVLGWATEATDDYTGNPNGDWEANLAPRHKGMVNIVSHSGTAATVDPESIHPKLGIAQIDRWLPRADRVGLEEDEEGRLIPLLDEFDPPADPPPELGTYGIEPTSETSE